MPRRSECRLPVFDSRVMLESAAAVLCHTVACRGMHGVQVCDCSRGVTSCPIRRRREMNAKGLRLPGLSQRAFPPYTNSQPRLSLIPPCAEEEEVSMVASTGRSSRGEREEKARSFMDLTVTLCACIHANDVPSGEDHRPTTRPWRFPHICPKMRPINVELACVCAFLDH